MQLPSDDPLHTALDPAERRLYMTLWVLLIFAFAIWHFWPHLEFREPSSHIPVEIGAELQGRVEQANVYQTSPSQAHIQVQLSPRYLHSLPEEGQRVMLGYDLMGDEHVLFSGLVSVHLTRPDEMQQIILPNPERVFTRRIRIYLAH